MAIPCRLAFMLCCWLAAATTAHATAPDLQAPLADLQKRLAAAGAARIEGTTISDEKTLPSLFFGERKVNNTFDAVDAVRRAHKVVAVVYVVHGLELVRISTNLLTPEGKRGLASNMPHDAAYEKLMAGQPACGAGEMLGTTFDACAGPIRDAADKVIAVAQVGVKK